MPTIEVNRAGDVAEILLNRPEKKNALREDDFAALRTAVEAFSHDMPRAVLVHGAGGAFCAGLDIGSLDPTSVDGGGILHNVVNPALRALRALPVPTIAAVSGPCLGGRFWHRLLLRHRAGRRACCHRQPLPRLGLPP